MDPLIRNNGWTTEKHDDEKKRQKTAPGKGYKLYMLGCEPYEHLDATEISSKIHSW